MKEFLKMLGASVLGVIIGGMLCFLFSMMIIFGIAASFGDTPAYHVKDNTILHLQLEGTITDRTFDSPFDYIMNGGLTNKNNLSDILKAIQEAKNNEKIKGIYISSGYLSTGYATLEPIRKALIDFKESGKFIISYGDIISQRAYYITSVADKVYMNPQGMLEFNGLGSMIQFNRDIFKKWGVDIQVFKVGTYKSAVEPYTETRMSDANREQVTAFLNDIWGNLLAGISESRGISVEQLNAYADEYLMLSDPNKIVEYKLVDGLKYKSEVENELKGMLGIEVKEDLTLATTSNIKQMPNLTKKTGNKIAILYAEGSIVGDEAESLYSNNSITAKTYVKELRDLLNDDDVKAVVFRVNSGGGSAYASEQIWHAVKELNSVKPVIVSMGDYAASGGYYISCSARKIVAEHNTLTGSIGIFGMYPSGEQLADKFGAHYDGVGTNAHTLLGSETLTIPFLGIGLLPARPLNESELNMFQTYVERGYQLFLTRCAEGRDMTIEEIDAVGQGRVWTGNQALSLGLVDELGGIDRAIEIAAKEANITDYHRVEYPEQKDFFTALMEETSQGFSTRFAEIILGEETVKQRQMLNIWQNFDFRQAIITETIQ